MSIIKFTYTSFFASQYLTLPNPSKKGTLPYFLQLRIILYTQLRHISPLAAGSHTQDWVSHFMPDIHICEWQQS